MAKSKKKKQPLSDKDLAAVSGGISIPQALQSMGHGLRRGLKEGEDAVVTAGKTVLKTGTAVADGLLVGGKDLIDTVINSGHDLYQGKVGDAAKELISGPVAAAKAVGGGVISGADALIDGTIDTGDNLVKAALDLATLGLGEPINLTPRIEGFLDGVAQGINSSSDAVAKLARDTFDTGIDMSALPATTLSKAFADLTKGKFKAAAGDVIHVPFNITSNSAKLMVNDLTDPTTIMGLFNTAGVIATFATFGAAAPAEAAIAGETVVAEAAEGAATAAEAATTASRAASIFGSASRTLASLAPDVASLPPAVQAQFRTVQATAAQLAALGPKVGLDSTLSGSLKVLIEMLKGVGSPQATALRLSLNSIQANLDTHNKDKS